MRSIYLNERCNVLLIPRTPRQTGWTCKPVVVETVEMNTLLINGTFYERGREISGLVRLHEIKDQESEIKMMAEEEEYYRNIAKEETLCALCS